jgi:tetratricopeptide (TPR) repeat protein
MRKLSVLLLAFTLLSLVICAIAQRQHHAPAANTATANSSDEENSGWVPREILERPVTVRPGLGPVHEKVTTQSKTAQAFYDQGLAYLHSYVWIESARSFKQALRLDPQMAMAYVGLSRAYSGLTDPPAAREAWKKAEALAGHVSEWERARIRLRGQQLDATDDIDNTAKLAGYRKAIDDELARRPKDIELLLVRGNAEEPFASGRGQRGLATAVQYYDRVLAIQPENPAAHHYLVHTYEDMGQPEEAVQHGEVYARVTPNIAHAQHMYGHDLQKVNRNAEAAAQFQKAEDIEEAYYRDEHIDVRYDWHHIHNLDLMSISRAFMGQMKDAEALWREGFAAPPTSGLWEAYQAKWPEFLLQRGRPQEALVAAQKLAAGRWPVGRTMGHLLAGRAYLRLNQVEKAHSEMAAAKQESLQIEDVDPEPLLPHPKYMPVFQTSLLNAEMDLRSGSKDADQEMRDLLLKTKEGFRNADATAGLFLIQFVADDARTLQHWELARFAAEQDIRFDPNYAGGHYEMGLVEAHAGNAAGERTELSKAVELWKSADPDLEELVQARKLLAELSSSASSEKR